MIKYVLRKDLTILSVRRCYKLLSCEQAGIYRNSLIDQVFSLLSLFFPFNLTSYNNLNIKKMIFSNRIRKEHLSLINLFGNNIKNLYVNRTLWNKDRGYNLQIFYLKFVLLLADLKNMRRSWYFSRSKSWSHYRIQW